MWWFRQNRSTASGIAPTPVGLTPVTEEDHALYPDIKAPEEGTPLVGDVDFNGVAGKIFVSRNEVRVILLSPVNGPSDVWVYKTPFAQGKALAPLVLRARSIIDLRSLGFTQQH